MRRIAGVVVIVLLVSKLFAQSIHSRDGITLPPPPVAEANPVIDNYFGTKITDNYRWLEDAKSPETRAFIDQENAYTTRYLKQNPIRNQAVDDLDPLEHTSRWTIPIQRAGNYYFMKRLAGEEQASIYMRRGWTGAASKGVTSTPKDERLVDPAAISRDPNTSVRLADVSRDGLFLAYQVRQGGADEATVRVYSVTKKKPLEDELPAGIYYSIEFTPDSKGLYYARTDRKGTLLYLHAIGTRNADDKLIFGREFHGELLGPIDLFMPTSLTTPTTSSSPSSAASLPSGSTSVSAISPSPVRPSTCWSGDSTRASRQFTQRADGTFAPTIARPMAASSAPIPASCPRHGRLSCPKAKT